MSRVDRMTTSPATPPVIPGMIYGMFRARSVCAAAELGIADALASGPLDAEELARRCGAHARSLTRLMRYLIGEGVFARTPDGRFALNDAADTLREDAPVSFRAMARSYGSLPVWSGWGHLLTALKTGTSGFGAANGLEFFHYLEEHPHDAAIFNQFMTSMAARRSPVHLYDFSSASTVVDVGGGHGAMLINVLQAHTHLRGVLVDTAEVVVGARESIVAAGLESRCEVIAASIFDAVPGGGDTYILSNILHDWNDDDALRILASCRAAMKPGNVLVIVELIVTDDDEPSMAKTIDMQMMTTGGGIQRTVAEFEVLFDQTGFGSARIVPPGLLVATAA